MDLAKPFFSYYEPGRLMGEMWLHAIETYSTQHSLDSYDSTSSGGMVSLHTPERYVLFGDPSLRGGGIVSPPVDTEPPEIFTNLPGNRVQNGFMLRLDPVDRPSGSASGVHKTFLSIDGGDAIQTRSHYFLVPFGSCLAFHIAYHSDDFMGNEEIPRIADFQVDSMPPTCSFILSGDAPGIGDADYGGPVTVQIHSYDSPSGVDGLSILIEEWLETYGPPGGYWIIDRMDYLANPDTGAGSFDTDFLINRGGRYRVNVSARDRAGNESEIQTSTFSIWYFDLGIDFYHDLRHIFAGPALISLPPQLNLPFTPDQVDFYISPAGVQWTSIGTDIKV